MKSGSMELFQPLQLKKVKLRNRFVLPAMQRGHTVAYAPSPAVIDFLEACARGGVSLLFSEAAGVNHPSTTWQTYVSLLNEATAPVWKGAIERIHKAGSAMIIQIWHEGAVRQEHKGGPAPDYPTLSPSGLIQRDNPNGQAASLEQLIEIKRAFVEAATLAQGIGADGVELSCAHGYMLDLFLWAETNLRTDRYGGASIVQRAQFIVEIVQETRQAVGPDFLIGVRLSQWKEVDYKARVVESPGQLGALLKALESAGVDFFDLSTRYFHHPEWPDQDPTLGLAGWARRYTEKPIIAVGSVGLSVDVMDTFFGDEKLESHVEQSVMALEDRLRANEFDLISVGRGCIGDPEFVSKVQAGNFQDIRPFTRRDLTFLADYWKADRIADTHERNLLQDLDI